jgi:hypothetical protein
MNVHLPIRCGVPEKTSKNGMGRFFSPRNLGRYRRLAGDKVDAAERNRVLKVLAEEWGAFTRECRMPSRTNLRSCKDGVVFKVNTKNDSRSQPNS